MSEVVVSRKDYLVELVKAAGQEILDRAEDIVGDGGQISDLTLWVNFPAGEVPTIEVQREHLITNSFDLIGPLTVRRKPSGI